MKNSSREASAGQREGMTYVSGMSTVMERAAAAASVASWIPEAQSLTGACSQVIVDIETTGLGATADIVQLAAKYGSKEFSAYMLPRSKFSSEASAVTGMRVQGNRLWQNEACLETIPASRAAQEFVQFLRQCSSQVVLVGHNIVRFDAPRIMRLLREHGLAKEFCSLVFGFTDTVPLIKQGRVRKQEDLAKMLLKGPEWEELIRNAHDALTDCIILDGLLTHLKIADVDIKKTAVSTKEFMERQVQIKRKKEHTPGLIEMAAYGVSMSMIGKMAANGITIEEMAREYRYRAHGRKGLEVCLGVQLNGKPRVTRSRKILDCVEAFLQSKDS